MLVLDTWRNINTVVGWKIIRAKVVLTSQILPEGINFQIRVVVLSFMNIIARDKSPGQFYLSRMYLHSYLLTISEQQHGPNSQSKTTKFNTK